ncbi:MULTISPECIES: transglutaminase-like domain-containing protein [unclassified Paenibacillus]|uniref:transglutaminase-like domain-containing protein n=1 Tax=unclassified Paenibacillus TaxID=185978 RepID=UPI0024058746|nr:MULTISPECIES: transglutaminase-like domain-containing protein [unclassified Paenibacillus]MDF9844734.1 transglutaminase/protease-like cytokinesis protein 3 [Paenibacillus sp. PastF-2]MDF9851336.1 transglutaminase/protease-like cytokinesis protein 3 [Paenibacillus sp. PastM-2]MDF9857918.1 transglutaminase/protease-like cytokinesis protein 3 [Paenibacillus sp. PastF-1]MDH6483185.1 transglutaminase/protease-like cytokinesis protein 3 [Paenibacillus sp. PastH-2]MDH6510559.1 transglutaminase/pro
MKKFYFMLLTLFVVVTSVQTSTASAATADSSWLNTSKLDQGVVAVSYDVPADKRIKVMITKDGNSYTYNLYASQSTESFPLQQGNGTYKVSVLENTTGNKYKVVSSEDVELKLSNANAVYLSSVQNVKWTSSDKAVLKAKQLTQGLTTDEAKVKAIYNYIVANVKYDNALAANVTPDYIPNNDNTLLSKKGICYDYASLFATMLRSEGIPTKLVMGNTSYVSTYHAWNEVLLNGKWVTIDTTVDAGLAKNNKDVGLTKVASKYSAAKFY